MFRRSRFFYIVCSTSLSLLSMSLMASPTVPAPKPITDVASKVKEESSNVVKDKKLDAPPVPAQEEIPMMSPATPSAPAAPPPLGNRLNLNNMPPANNQQRMLNPHRPMDSGY